MQTTLADVAAEVENKLKEVANRTLAKLREMDPAIAASLNPVIPSAESLKWQDVFKMYQFPVMKISQLISEGVA